MDEKKRVAKSVHQRLLNKAREEGRPFNELLQYYAMEKFLLRVSKSNYTEEFVLKGALMLRAVGIGESRPTRDIDLHSDHGKEIEELEKMISDCCRIEVEEDGLLFDPESVEGEDIRDQQAYQGVRLKVRGSFGTAKILIQIDIGFGDAIVPGPLWIEYPVILEGERPKLKGYTLESAIAEKFEAMVSLDMANSRMKDFYDIYSLITHRTFDKGNIQQAIEETFKRRKTRLPDEKPVAFTETFFADEDKLKQWNAFKEKLPEKDGSLKFKTVVKEIDRFIWPIVKQIINKYGFCYIA